MNLKDQVKLSLRWKKSDEICAKRLGMKLDTYKRVKSEIKNWLNSPVPTPDKSKITEFQEDLGKGTATIKGLSLTEPKSPEEIIEILKIDTEKWQLSSYWNKQHRDHWLISAMVTKRKTEPAAEIKKVVESFNFQYTTETAPIINSTFTDKTCAVLSLQDIHVGKVTIDNIDTTVDSVKKCIKSLIGRSYHSNNLDKIIFVLGGDLVNMDTYLGTTTSGTVIENAMPAYDAYKIAFDLMFWAVNYLKQFCNELEVVYIPGNHSRLTEAHIAYALSKCIHDPHIHWNIDYAERKVVVYGDNMLCFEHGDFDTKKSFYVFATEYAKEWGATTTRTLYTGHFHKEKTVQYVTRDETNGFTIKILPSLSKTDMYHYSNKWTGNKRGGIIELYSEKHGCTGNFSYYE